MTIPSNWKVYPIYDPIKDIDAIRDPINYCKKKGMEIPENWTALSKRLFETEIHIPHECNCPYCDRGDEDIEDVRWFGSEEDAIEYANDWDDENPIISCVWCIMRVPQVGLHI